MHNHSEHIENQGVSFGKIKVFMNLFVLFSLVIVLFGLKIFDVNNFLETTQLNWVLKIRDFLTFFFAIVVEAFPFVVLGVVISILVGLFVKEDWLLKILPKNKFLRHALISIFGVFMPVCECGNIPVARRLISKGFTSSESITFLLAAPIINPITFLSTFEAFRFLPEMVWVRMGSGFFIAIFIGMLMSRYKDQKSLLTDKFIESCKADHKHSHSKLEKGIEIFQTEFLEIMKMLIIGAMIAAVSQTFIPREVIVSVGTNPFFSVIAMVILAFVISICSNVDAFFALSYANTFTKGALSSFLVFGPMIDIKVLAMLRSTFKSEVLFKLSILVSLFSILVGLIHNFFG